MRVLRIIGCCRHYKFRVLLTECSEAVLAPKMPTHSGNCSRNVLFSMPSIGRSSVLTSSDPFRVQCYTSWDNDAVSCPVSPRNGNTEQHSCQDYYSIRVQLVSLCLHT